MSLRKELQAAVAAHHKRFEPSGDHQQETADDLLNLVLIECRARAAAGCSTFLFHWAYVYTADPKEWEAQQTVVLEVVSRLNALGVIAESPSNFPPTFLNYADEVEQPDGHHHILVDWR